MRAIGGTGGTVFGAIACGAALVISVVPGALGDLLWDVFLGVAFLLPGIALGVVVALAVLLARGTWRRSRFAWRQALVVLSMVGATAALLGFHVPTRIAFAVSRSSFEELLPEASASAELNRAVGVFRVDACAADPRGGVYFRVHSGGDGFGPDTMSYGFAFRPNASGTPFGAARYRLWSLGQGWHVWRASNDG